MNNTHFVNDLAADPVIKTFLAKAGTNAGLIDLGAPKGMTGKRWFDEYLEEHNINIKYLEKEDRKETFGSYQTFNSEGYYKVPVTLKNVDGNEVTEVVGMHVVNAKIPFLIGMDILEEQGGVIDLPTMTIVFKKSGNIFPLKKTSGGHVVLDLLSPSTETYITEDDDSDEQDPSATMDDIDSYKRIRNVHRASGCKLEKNMIDMYKQSGKYDPKMKKIIQEVIKRCKTCQMKKKSQPRPKVSLMKAKSPNDIVTLDLELFTVRGK